MLDIVYVSILSPLIVILSVDIGYRCNNCFKRVDFPDPVFPTIPIDFPFSILIFKSFKE